MIGNRINNLIKEVSINRIKEIINLKLVKLIKNI